MNMPPPPEDVQNERMMIDAQIKGSHDLYDARQSVIKRSPTGSPTGSPGRTGRQRRGTMLSSPVKPSIAGGKRRTYKKCGGKRHKKSKTSKKRGHKKSKTSKKRGHKKRA